MAVVLAKKGTRVDLTKTNPGLKKVRIGLGWDTNKYDGGHDFDLDAVVFLANAQGKVTEDRDFIFYNNLEHYTGAVVHSGDNLTGSGDGEDETIFVEFGKIPQHIEKIAVCVTIHEATERGQTFGMVLNSFVNIYDADTDEQLLRFDLGEDFSIETGVVVCELYKHDGHWKFNAIGSGYSNGLAGLVRDYGLQVK
ncbi:TerD family protein [Bacillus phage YungSlug]|nr:TerD family protein [Bacillus phage YungSlug]